MRIALYGGAFNPPHVGHLMVVSYVLATADVDQVWLMPAHRHPFGKELVPFVDRVEMCTRLGAFFAKGVQTTTVECEVSGSGRTVDTLEHLRTKLPGHTFRLVIGSDILDEAPLWKDFDRVRQLAPLIVVPRGGHPHPQAPGPAMPAVSSTEVRARLASGKGAESLVPKAVLEYIRARGLYGVPPAP
ncbi:nicotinate (nicotinamide) nucleotide adenylyltransferase [Vulgatibacter incomptus]|uniref:Probable nicotinate-nucleotide adenylyltransferase n=1 Tax=Vulgatibacter incomptus TaxID=1391653 RepID=A0A0K1PBH6_9BACT|nr:nicotinate (nicotinamide) nucleotide adenylyltransferase [Vulgatibacter incomptus]AKU90479.1 Nicotinate-nucleotide adenylyltransferase [Vulgatibacter incomptus]